MPGLKCQFTTEGEDKTQWKIPTVYIDPKTFDFAGVNKPTIAERFSIKEDMKDKLDGPLRHRAVASSDYFCLQLKLMNHQANVIVGMWNWVHNITGMGGDARWTEMNTEWANTSKIGYEKLHEDGATAWKKVFYEM